MMGKMLSHYRLVEKIGEGGMGVVWKADDTVLGRTVAIKVLPADVAPDEKRRQLFLNEARLAASVSHAHIVQVHDLGREADLDFIVMEYVDGRPLSSLLRSGPLSPERVTALGLQIAEGLSRAHHKKLLHRDLKPGNVLVTTDGEVKIVDFGLAVLFEPRDGSTTAITATLQVEGVPDARSNIAGTVPYMSPEQLSGEKLDARSDVFSLGAVLYEMTTGRRPFDGADARSVAQAILACKPIPTHQLTPTIPLELHRIIEKALARRKEDRYQTMDDVVVDLRRLARDLDSGSSPSFQDLRAPKVRRQRARRRILLAGALGLCAMAVIGWRIHVRDLTGAKSRGVRAILISPMEVRGQTDGADYLGRAFAEAVAIGLVAAPALEVVPIPSTGPLQIGTAEFDRLAKGRNPDLFLSGALSRDGKELNLTLTLVDPRSRKILWGLQDSGGSGETARMAAGASQQIIEHLGLALPRRYEYFRYAAGSARMTGSVDLLPAISALRRHDGAESLRLTQRLIEAFPEEYEAHVMRVTALVDAHNSEHSTPSRSALEQGLEEVRHVDSHSPIPDLFNGWLIRDHDGDLPRAWALTNGLLAREDVTAAFRAHALREHAITLMCMDSLEVASKRLAEARQLDPANGWNYTYSGLVATRMGRLEEAVERRRQAVALEPGNWVYHGELAGSLAALERWDEAIRESKISCDLSPTQANYAYMAQKLLKAGRLDDSKDAARHAAELPATANGMLQLGRYWAGEGSSAEALRCLRQAVKDGMDVDIMRDDPQLESLRGSPAFDALLGVPRRPGQ